MKITTGKFKYRNIEIPAGIRPTGEKVREAVFSMISPWIEDAVVLDLFAGSGAMGLEAISRGAAHCHFCESSRAVYNTLQANIDNCEAAEYATLYNSDYISALSKLEKNEISLDIIIMDPPYERTDYYVKALESLQSKHLVDDGSMVVAEHLYDKRLSDIYKFFHKIKEKKYGTIGVDVFIYENRDDLSL